MLREIRIQNLGVIDDAVLELSAGLNVVTGETGAGKTMVVSGLGLLLGARADAGLVRTGARSAVVEGMVDVDETHPAAARAAEAGGDVAGRADPGPDGLGRGALQGPRRRTHRAGQRPRASSARCSSPCTASPTSGGCASPSSTGWCSTASPGPTSRPASADYAGRYDEFHQVAAEVTRLRALARDRAREVDVLRAGLEEIEAVDPQPGEDDDLRAEDERLAHADGLRASAAQAHALLSGDDDESGAGGVGVSEQLAAAHAAITGMTEHDPCPARPRPPAGRAGLPRRRPRR